MSWDTAINTRWADDATHAGESVEAALVRRVKMHHFLAQGGVVVGIDAETKRGVYTSPIDIIKTAECPWHPRPSGTSTVQPCSAWVKLRQALADPENPEMVKFLTATVPKPQPTLAELRDMTVEEFEEERERLRIAMHQRRILVPQPTPRKTRLVTDPKARQDLLGEVPDEIDVTGDEEEEE